MTGQYYQPQPGPYSPNSPEADSVKSLIRIAGIFGIIVMIIGVIVTIVLALIIWPIAVFGLLTIILGWAFYDNCKKINEMIDLGQYQKAKSKTLVWMIIGLIALNMIPGIVLLIAYMKFDDLMRGPVGYGYMPPPPQQMRLCTGCGQQIPVQYNNCPHCGLQMK